MAATTEWPGARVRSAFNEFFQSKAHTYWPSNAVVSFRFSASGTTRTLHALRCALPLPLLGAPSCMQQRRASLWASRHASSSSVQR